MTAERKAAELHQDDETLEPSDSTLKAVLGSTLTLIALHVAMGSSGTPVPSPGLAAAVAER